jgi:hypothetical protein
MAQSYGLILWINVNDCGYGIVIIYLAMVKGERLRRMFNEKN